MYGSHYVIVIKRRKMIHVKKNLKAVLVTESVDIPWVGSQKHHTKQTYSVMIESWVVMIRRDTSGFKSLSTSSTSAAILASLGDGNGI